MSVSKKYQLHDIWLTILDYTITRAADIHTMSLTCKWMHSHALTQGNISLNAHKALAMLPLLFNVGHITTDARHIRNIGFERIPSIRINVGLYIPSGNRVSLYHLTALRTLTLDTCCDTHELPWWITSLCLLNSEIDCDMPEELAYSLRSLTVIGTEDMYENVAMMTSLTYLRADDTAWESYDITSLPDVPYTTLRVPTWYEPTTLASSLTRLDVGHSIGNADIAALLHLRDLTLRNCLGASKILPKTLATLPLDTLRLHVDYYAGWDLSIVTSLTRLCVYTGVTSTSPQISELKVCSVDASPQLLTTTIISLSFTWWPPMYGIGVIVRSWPCIEDVLALTSLTRLCVCFDRKDNTLDLSPCTQLTRLTTIVRKYNKDS